MGNPASHPETGSQARMAEHSRKGRGSKCSLSFKVLGKESKKTPKVGAHGAVYISKPTHVQTLSAFRNENLVGFPGLAVFSVQSYHQLGIGSS